jgi:hypothetical protein
VGTNIRSEQTASVDAADLEPPPPSLPAGARLAGRYRIERPLGRGGFATVYRAVDEVSGGAVALKLLRPDRVSAVALRRLRREGRAAEAADHPALVRVLDEGASPEGPFLVMELVDGETLRERLARGPLGADEAARVGLAVAEGLQALHEAGLVHRDVKPSNILLAADGRVRLGDLGLITTLGDDETRATRADGLIGTLEYVAPEQALGQAVDGRSDLYSLGVSLFETISGELPFTAASSLGSVLARVTEEPTPLSTARPDTPGWMVGIVGKLLAREPAHRYSTAAELVADLRQRKAPSDARGTRRSRRGSNRTLVAMLGLAVLAILVLGLARLATAPGARLVAADVQSGVLRGIDDGGNVLWSHRFPVPLDDEAYRPERGTRIVVRGSGGSTEVWALAATGRDARPVLHAFTATGASRLAREPGRSVSFGGRRFERFRGESLLPVGDGQAGTRLFLAANHESWFPAVVEELGPDGTPLGEFWSPGHVVGLELLRFGGRDVLAVLAANNELRGAGLALVDLRRFGGSMPASAPAYRCDDCPGPEPLAALVFPGSDVLRAAHSDRASPVVASVHETEGGIAVNVRHVTYSGPVSTEASIRYVLSPDARRVLALDATDGYVEAHRRQRAEGLLDHDFGPGDLRQLARVVSWDGTAYREIAREP